MIRSGRDRAGTSYLQLLSLCDVTWAPNRCTHVSFKFISQYVVSRVKEQSNILHEIRKRKANWIGHILRRNCLLQRVIEGKIQRG